MVKQMPRSIAVVDVGYTNTKVILFAPDLTFLAERKMASPHHKGKVYGEIDVEPMLEFFASALPELDKIAPIDCISVSAHGACIAAMKRDGSLAVPLMDYLSEPPADILAAYSSLCPSYAETYSPQLPVALLHAMQLFWQQRALSQDFKTAETILPLMQYVAACLGGKPVTEISSMGCQSHLLDLNTLGPSKLAVSQGWAEKFAPRANAWDVIGKLKPDFRGSEFRGKGEILAGVHDSNANYLRYLAGGQSNFTLLSTGTWIISFDTKADIKTLDPTNDIVANVDVMGRRVACSRFFGGKEFEILSQGANGTDASLPCVARLIASNVMALPSFSDAGGPMPNSANKGTIMGTVTTNEERASLASLYCALMMTESLAALHASGDIIVDGPFSQNKVFLAILAALHPGRKLRASNLKDGTAAGAACLGLMPDGLLPHIDIDMTDIAPAILPGLSEYRLAWQKHATENAR